MRTSTTIFLAGAALLGAVASLPAPASAETVRVYQTCEIFRFEPRLIEWACDVEIPAPRNRDAGPVTQADLQERLAAPELYGARPPRIALTGARPAQMAVAGTEGIRVVRRGNGEIEPIVRGPGRVVVIRRGRTEVVDTRK